MDHYVDFAYSTIAVAPSPPTTGTSLTLQSGDGALFPAPPFNTVIAPVDSLPLLENAEIVRVTGKTADTLTIERRQEGTAARQIGTGDQIFAGVTAKTLTDLVTLIEAETSRAEAAEATLGTGITAETTRAEGAESSLSTGIATETTRAKAAEKAAQEAAEAASAQGLNPTAVKNAAYEAKPGDYIPVDISAGAVPVALPNAPADKTRVGLKIIKVPATVGEHTLTVERQGTDVFNVAGGSTVLTLSAKFQSVLLQYQHSTGIWYVQTTDTPLNEPLGAALLGTDGTVGGPSGSALSASVVTSRLKSNGEVEGTLTPNYAEGSTVLATMKGALTFEKPTGWPSVPAWMDVSLTQDAVGHTLKIGAGIAMPGGEPLWSKAALAVNQFSLWSPDGGATVFLFTGPEGPKGAAGERGERGEVGPSSIEAMTRASYPWISGNSKATGSFAPTQWKVYFALVVVPVKAKKLALWLPNAGEVSGHLRAFVFDIGAATAKKYTCLAASPNTLFTPTTINVQEKIATLERKDGKEWEPGEVIMVGIGADTAATKLALSTAITSALMAEFAGGAINGTGNMTAFMVCGEHTYSEAAFKAAEPAALSEAEMTHGSNVLPVTCRWE